MAESFDSWHRRARNGDLESFEKTHDENGAYKGSATSSAPISNAASSGLGFGQTSTPPPTPTPTQEKPLYSTKADILPKASDPIVPTVSSHFVVYTPRNDKDVQAFIDFLTRREPAIVNLDGVNPADAQRALDFISGAAYALDAKMTRVSGNIFAISPEGMEILRSDDTK